MKAKREAWPQLKTNKPIIIAGPCSAETEEKVLETARALKQDDRVSIFRAGIWKPRTRPGGFEGIGSTGLPWLNTVQREIGLPVTIEVANAKHVEEALKAGMDMLWIGARTTGNPFSMQEVADALRGVDIPVLVKNPVSPDVALWMGALERLEKTGISRLGAIHRGVTHSAKSLFRNRPEWQMAIELREKLPDMLLINDPSHIAGRRDLIYQISQKAMDLKFDGLMIETHCSPNEAWSDAAQQVKPEQLRSILDQITLRAETPAGIQLKSIEDLRTSINEVDDQLLELLSHRMEISQDIAVFKSKNNMTIFQEGRWNELLEKYHVKADNLGLSPQFVSKVFHNIHQESIDRQSEIFNREVNEVK